MKPWMWVLIILATILLGTFILDLVATLFAWLSNIFTWLANILDFFGFSGILNLTKGGIFY